MPAACARACVWGGQWAGLLVYGPWLPCPLPSAFSINLVQVVRIALRAAGLVRPARAAPVDGAVGSGTDGLDPLPAPLPASRVAGAVVSASRGSVETEPGYAPGNSNGLAGILFPTVPPEIAVWAKEGATATEGVDVPGEHSRRRLLGGAAATPPAAPAAPSVVRASISPTATVIFPVHGWPAPTTRSGATAANDQATNATSGGTGDQWPSWTVQKKAENEQRKKVIEKEYTLGAGDGSQTDQAAPAMLSRGGLR